MMLIDAVKSACARLAPLGWAALLRRHDLDITRVDLAAELQRELAVDRSVPGFEDFALTGVRGIEPGKPAASLLYHALASPDVHPTRTGEPAAVDAYPTLVELDAIENYVYGLQPPGPAVLAGAVVAVFAYQYRPAASTAHGYHADLVFSRAGVARVGTAAAVWHGPWRSFRSDPPGRKDIAVTPARYAAFLAVARTPRAADAIMGRREAQDVRRPFVFPLHKLFPGRECLPGTNTTLDFKEFHRNDKLRRLHTAGRVKVVPGFDVKALPFVRDSTNGGALVKLRRAGASVLVVPVHHDTLVRTVTQTNSKSRRREIVRFIVPKATEDNRYATSLEMESDGEARPAPEYANIRHRVVKGPRGTLVAKDMRSLDEEAFKTALAAGGYEAAHFTDDTCDGALVATVGGLGPLRGHAAYSLVSAPDFFPLADQLEVTSWVRRNFQNHQEHFTQGAPWPLCEGRHAANLELPWPGAPNRKAFARADKTVPAIVGTRPLSIDTHAPDRKKRFGSFLPDSASNYFEPGWDVSLARDDQGLYFTAYGLGSPFPEDSKLCAALNSFWPAVAPDASRTFHVDWSPTAIPLLDGELGYHADHPLVKAGRVASRRGWDGEYGPFFEDRNGQTQVNYASLDRSDYVSNSLAGHLNVRTTAGIDAPELIRRMDALRRCIKALPPSGDRVSSTKLWLISAEGVADWTDPERADAALEGRGFVYTFALVPEDDPSPGGDLTRLRLPVTTRFECQISDAAVYFRQDRGVWRRGAPG
jgi:hypothetical protein